MGKNKRKIYGFLLFLFIFLSFASCYLSKKPIVGVSFHEHDKICIRGGKCYRVGYLPNVWRKMKMGAFTASFYNDALLSSISTSAFCGGGDKPLSALAGDIAAALENKKVMELKNFTLDGRSALREKVSGNVDGVAVFLDIVIVKKDGCVFDFTAASPSEDKNKILSAEFSAFFGTFSFPYKQ